MKVLQSHRKGHLLMTVLGLCLTVQLLAAGTTMAAGPVIAFGPQDYEREWRFPRWEKSEFDHPGEELSYILRIENGGAQGQYRRVRFAFIKLNGELIVGPWDLRGWPEIIERPVNLEDENTLKVLLMGLPGSGFTVTVLGIPSTVVPNVVGLTRSEAEAVLGAAGLGVGATEDGLSLVVPAGTVLVQDPVAGQLASPGDLVDLTLAGTPAGATPISDAWVGLWQFSVMYTDPDTGSTVAEEEIEGALCPGDVVGPIVINQAAGDPGSPLSSASFCSVNVSDGLLDVTCDAELVFDADCTVDALVSLAGTVDGDELIAIGAWSTVAIGACAPLPPVSGEDVAVIGTRVDANPGVCDPPRSSLTQQLVRHPNLLLLGLGEELVP